MNLELQRDKLFDPWQRSGSRETLGGRNLKSCLFPLGAGISKTANLSRHAALSLHMQPTLLPERHWLGQRVFCNPNHTHTVYTQNRRTSERWSSLHRFQFKLFNCFRVAWQHMMRLRTPSFFVFCFSQQKGEKVVLISKLGAVWPDSFL